MRNRIQPRANSRIRRRRRALHLLAGAAAVAVCLAGVLACGSSTDPGGGGGEVTITFSPSTGFPSLIVGQSLTFTATVEGSTRSEIRWFLNGAPVDSQATYAYTAGRVGEDVVAVTVTADRTDGDREWRVAVAPDVSNLPPQVTGLQLRDGDEPGEVVLRWARVTGSAYPIAGYEVACSYDGAVSAANWDEALPLGFYAETGDLYNFVTYTEADGMVPGSRVWFAVRAVDESDQMSAVGEPLAHDISYAWNLVVRVTDDTGTPVFNAILDWGCPSCRATTDAQGRATIGPLRSSDTLVVRTISNLFNVVSEPHGVADGETLDLVLLNRYAQTIAPCPTATPPDFLAFLRLMTLTDRTTENRDNYRLWRWAEYPLAIHIPDYVAERNGWRLQPLVEEAVAIWNEALGETFLVLEPNPLAADIEVEFSRLSGRNGETELLLPAGAEQLWETIPERVRVTVSTSLVDDPPVPEMVFVTEVALHELGHALGLYNHVCSSSGGNLMDNGGALGSLDEGAAAAITPDEWRAVRAIRYLPQGVDMEAYDAN